jgi:hypothetical protein
MDSTGSGQGKIVHFCEYYNVHLHENEPRSPRITFTVTEEGQPVTDSEQTQILNRYQIWPSYRKLGEEIMLLFKKKLKLCSYFGHFMIKSTVNQVYS